ncbi:AraC family transcriptional regulator [Treponema primitia]|uniref:AraC family transcriptional regulator n=1 Tax=Treponema primitia TaxID=88058 RepID=UPI0039800EE5
MGVHTKSEQKPWQEKESFAYSFPYRSWDSMMPLFTFPLHWHEYHEILYVLKGKTYASLAGETYEVSEGDIITINDSVLHGFFPSSPGTSVRIFQFESKIFNESGFELQDGVHGEPVFARKPLLSAKKDGILYKKAVSLIMDMFGEYNRRDAGFRLSIKSKLYEFALMFLREMPSEQFIKPNRNKNTKYVNERLEQILSFIFKNFDKPNITLDDAAGEAALSKFHFTRFLKGQTGHSFHSYLSMVRISHAVEYLVKTDTSVTDIAYQSGFSSLKTFNRVFKTYTGKNPSQYRYEASAGVETTKNRAHQVNNSNF